jgi:hypothetical protein
MIVRMQMWDQADWDGIGYGETTVLDPGPILAVLQQSEPTRKPFGSYGIIIRSTDIPPAGTLKSHFLVPYGLETAMEEINGVQTAVNKVKVYDPNYNAPTDPEKFLRIYQELDNGLQVWVWDYGFSPGVQLKDRNLIELKELSLPETNSELPHLSQN